MKDWLKQVFHRHKWAILKQYGVDLFDGGVVTARYERYILQCSICGEVKCKDMR